MSEDKGRLKCIEIIYWGLRSIIYCSALALMMNWCSMQKSANCVPRCEVAGNGPAQLDFMTTLQSFPAGLACVFLLIMRFAQTVVDHDPLVTVLYNPSHRSCWSERYRVRCSHFDLNLGNYSYLYLQVILSKSNRPSENISRQ